ncbi:hydrogenase nickel incorporation protein HypB [Meiothermus sp. CFH 77666]|uniref:hydrogenase nickel incorporation protein HypB n=1 Tax=Meiothermus sp. CFH 77666 TaxID=2817942 RepID=UPI001AA02B8F|nr:hydrogenase nickel incorporation protein HypB [Meiothermus sp. CFH 77666]MBO1436206.1 hydrogenase nickel incorporation protein HypB [Meiothermus sp. CFH 77666]
MTKTPRILEVRANVLKDNDLLARSLRERFAQSRTLVLNLVSSPGSGKTTLLRQTLLELSPRYRVAALVGDLATDNDARRLAESGAPVRQIETKTLCHLEARMIEEHLEGWDLRQIDLLFIENVGNLVCPSSWDLGEDLRVALFSTTEGEDKPLKYPTLINTADIALITKIDLAEAVEFDHEAMYRNLREIRPGIEILEVSGKRGTGMAAWLERLEGALKAKRSQH